MKPCLRPSRLILLVGVMGWGLLSTPSAASSGVAVSPGLRAQVQQQAAGQIAQVLERAWDGHRRRLPFEFSLRSPSGIVVSNQDLTFEPNLQRSTYRTRVVAQLHNASTVLRWDFTFWMPACEVDSVRINGVDADFTASVVDYGGWKLTELRISFAQALQPGSDAHLELEHHGKLDCSTSYQMPLCEVKDDFLVLTGFPVAPYFQNDSSYDLHIVHDAALKSAASAEQVGEKALHDGRTVSSWHNDRFSNAILLALGKFDVREEKAGSKVSHGFSRQGDGPYRDAYVPNVLSIIDEYAKQYHSYDYDKMDYVVVSNNMGFAGLAGPSTVFLAKYMFGTDPKTPGADHVLAHELGHQWFAYIFPARDSYATWLSEGWTEYIASIHTGRSLSKAYGIDLESTYFRLYDAMYTYSFSPGSDHALTGNLLDDPSKLPMGTFVALAYVKGPMVVRTLANYLGGHDELANVIHDYGDKYAYQEYDTADFQKRLEEVSGKNLEDFFSRWVFHPGYPIYQIEVVDGTSEQGGKVLAKIHRSAGFPGRLEWVVTTDSGRKVVPVRFANKDALDTQVEVQLDSPLIKSSLDPEYKQLRVVESVPAPDTNGNGMVDGRDIIRIAWSLGARRPSMREAMGGSSSRFAPSVDVNRDGEVNDADLQTAIQQLGRKNGS